MLWPLKFFFLLQLSGIAPPPVCRNVQKNDASASSSPMSNVTTFQAPQRKSVKDVKLRKVLIRPSETCCMFSNFPDEYINVLLTNEIRF